MEKAYFIAATGTDMGKTLVTAALGFQLKAAGKPVQLLKPVASGFDEAQLAATDSGVLLHAMGKPVTMEEVEQISPWRFPAPVSPHLAGEIDPKALLDFCQTQIEQHPLTLIEGAGGVMTPLAERYTQLELMRELRLPVVLVTGSYVGTLSHTLTALEALKSAGVQVASIIVNESPDSATGLDETAQSLKAFMLFSCPVFTLPQISPTNCPWLHAPSLTEVLI